MPLPGVEGRRVSQVLAGCWQLALGLVEPYALKPPDNGARGRAGSFGAGKLSVVWFLK